MNTCAEHLFDAPSAFREQEIGRILLTAIAAGDYVVPQDARFMVYRIRAVVRDENTSSMICNDVAFVAKPLALTAQEQRQ